ncbi:MAG: hypothetical protein KQH63_20015 [Desulfobulbaceae bacterium]|nr:hypothetical protein [Desulfobulbaceae bacterium]
MTCFLQFYKNTEKAPSHIRMILHFEDDSNLAYDCSRKLGRIGIVESVANSSAGKNSAPMPLC